MNRAFFKSCKLVAAQVSLLGATTVAPGCLGESAAPGGESLPATVPGVEHVLSTDERRPLTVYHYDAQETNAAPETGVGTGREPLITFWGEVCTKGSYGWGQVAGTDSDFFVEYDCPVNARETRAYTSIAYSAALGAVGKKLLVQNLGVFGDNRRYRIVLGGEIVRRVFGENNSVTNWFLSTQGEMRYER